MLDMLPGITNTTWHARTHPPTHARDAAAVVGLRRGPSQAGGRAYGRTDSKRAVSVGRFGGLCQSFCPGGLLSAAVCGAVDGGHQKDINT